MSMENILDAGQNVLGTIEKKDDGSEIWRDTNGKIRGYYDPVSDHTRAADKSILAKGNVLRTLVC